MQTWFKRVQDSLAVLPECITYFDAELQQARYDCYLKGNRAGNHRQPWKLSSGPKGR